MAIKHVHITEKTLSLSSCVEMALYQVRKLRKKSLYFVLIIESIFYYKELFISDTLTLQLWRERREHQRGRPPSKGSVALTGVLGCEAGFALDREALTVALVLEDAEEGSKTVALALDSREAAVRWQVRRMGGTIKQKGLSAQNLNSL